MRFTPVLAAITLLSAGCLGNTYRIPRGSLMQLAQTAPEQRGQNVRVVQSFAGSDDAPRGAAVDSNTQVIVVVGVDGGGHDHHGGGGGGGGGVNTSGPHKGANVPSAKVAADDGKSWIIAAVVVAVALAFTEGARYDGWVQLHPMHPVHLYGPYGQYVRVPLAQLTPEQAAWANKAVIREDEGPFVEKGRAPLDRVGATYSVLLGEGAIPSANGETKAGFMGHIQFGVWPAQTVGIQLDIGLGWRPNEMDLAVYSQRYALELDIMPVSAGSLHFGGYAAGGLATRIEDGGAINGGTRDENSGLLGAGLLGQLELTTRLTLTGRAGVTWLHGERVSEFGLGLSIY